MLPLAPAPSPPLARSAEERLRALMDGSPYVSYVYSYPHKTAYRPLTPARSLADLWRAEDRDRLFLYLHVPFCEMRCGFCNLFTAVGTGDDAMAAYGRAIARQAEVVGQVLGRARFARVAIGGGTPTVLVERALGGLFDVVETLGADPTAIPVSVETSPLTATRERMRALAARGVDRVSIGVQSFDEAQAHALGRAQPPDVLRRALACIRESGIASLNIDLMYGIPGQSAQSWLDSLESALVYQPEELYLYPLYVRPLTGLARSSRAKERLRRTAWDEERLARYRAGRAFLLERGYQQVSMRMFRRADAPGADAPVYRCQEDGMVGLGAGARSYTDAVHYSTEYAVGAGAVKAITRAYTDRDARDFEVADYGVELDAEERRRRHVILSLGSDEGLDEDRYRARFGTDARADIPELDALIGAGLAAQAGPLLRLTERGLERSDAVGPWLFSAPVRRAMGDYDPR